MYAAGVEGGQHFGTKLVEIKKLINSHLILNLQYQTHLNICWWLKLHTL